jgi:hypothetical protein
MKLSVLIAVCLAVGAFAAAAAQAQKFDHRIDLSGFSSVPVGLHSTICATALSTHINVNHLRWTLRNRYAKMKRLAGMPANCREYYAPAIKGWDRIRVTFHYNGDVYSGETVFSIPAPVRP